MNKHEVPRRHEEHQILSLLTPDIQSDSAGNQADTLYSWEQVKQIPGIECRELIEGRCYAAKLVDENDVTVYFAVFEWETEDDDTVWINPFWYGCGTGSSLRELRHSCFGDDGYIFYAHMACFKAAAEWLMETFED